jgi:mRNA interferase RelE/StbE
VAFAAYEFIIGPLLDNPHRVGKQLRPPLNDRHSARRGTYRVLYRIDDERQRVTVVGVFSRADAYRARWQQAFVVAGSLSFPLFLLARELRRGTSEAARLRTTDTILLCLLAVAMLGLMIWVDAGWWFRRVHPWGRRAAKPEREYVAALGGIASPV